MSDLVVALAEACAAKDIKAAVAAAIELGRAIERGELCAQVETKFATADGPPPSPTRARRTTHGEAVAQTAQTAEFRDRALAELAAERANGSRRTAVIDP